MLKIGEIALSAKFFLPHHQQTSKPYSIKDIGDTFVTTIDVPNRAGPVYQSNGAIQAAFSESLAWTLIGVEQMVGDGRISVQSTAPHSWLMVLDAPEGADFDLKLSQKWATIGRGANSGNATPTNAMSEANAWMNRLVVNAGSKLALRNGINYSRTKWDGPWPDGHNPLVAIDLPTELITRAIQAEFWRHWVENPDAVTVVKQKIEPQEPIVQLNGETPIAHAVIENEVLLPAHFGRTIKLALYHDADTGEYEIGPDIDTQLAAIIEATNKQLLDRSRRIALGETVPLIEKPDFSELSESDLAVAEDWWLQLDQAQKSIKPLNDTSRLELLTGLGLEATATNEEILTALATKDGTSTTGTFWWTNAWDALKAAGGASVDIIKSWGPAGVIGAYAGYETIRSAKKSTVPTWLILGGLAAVVLMILK